MITEELGTKHSCPDSECGAKFYDLKQKNQNGVTCPKCQKSFKPEIILTSRKEIIEENKHEEDGKNKETKTTDKNHQENNEIIDEKAPFEDIDDIDLDDDDMVENTDDDDKFLEQEEDETNDVSMIIGTKINDSKSEE